MMRSSLMLLLSSILACATACSGDDESHAAGQGGGGSGGAGGNAGVMDSGGTGGMTSGGEGGAAGTVSGGMGGSSGGGSGGAGASGGSGGSGAGGMGGDAAVDGGDAGDDGSMPDGGDGDLVLTSTAFTDGGDLPAMYRCEMLFGDGGPSPPLAWTGAPAGAMSFALTMTDESNATAHWTMFDIPASTASLPEDQMTGGMPDTPAGAKQSVNSAVVGTNGPGYFGPCDSSENPYRFTLYALDVANLPGVTTASVRADVQEAIDEHTLGSASITALSGP